MKGRAILYSADEMAWLEANRLMVISDYGPAFRARFRRDVTDAHLHALRKRMGWKTGRTGCFVNGGTPINKGKRCAPGTGGNHPNARRTQFTKGERRGVAIKLYKPIGTERVNKDGYRERKIHDGMPLQSRWRAVHLVEWEAINGPVPKGHALKCMDGDRGNVDPSNWEAIPRSMLPRLAGGNRYRRKLAFDDAEPEARPTILAIARLEYAARQRAKREAQRHEVGSARKGEHAVPEGQTPNTSRGTSHG